MENDTISCVRECKHVFYIPFTLVISTCQSHAILYYISKLMPFWELLVFARPHSHKFLVNALFFPLHSHWWSSKAICIMKRRTELQKVLRHWKFCQVVSWFSTRMELVRMLPSVTYTVDITSLHSHYTKVPQFLSILVRTSSIHHQTHNSEGWVCIGYLCHIVLLINAACFSLT
jgi:hypothetical protein